MSEIINDITKMLSEHWEFFAVMFTFMIVAQVTKTSVFTKKRAEDTHNKLIGHFWWWGRKTLPIHPVVSGGIVGLFWTNPNDAVTSTIASIFYFAFAGAMSVWGYQILKGIMKKKNIELTLPGNESVTPPKPKKTNGSK